MSRARGARRTLADRNPLFGRIRVQEKRKDVMMAETKTDPIFNEACNVEIGGRKFGVRELSYRSARRSVLAIHDLVLAFKKANPDVKLSELDSGDKLVDALVNSLRELLSESADILSAMMAESTGLGAEEIDDLPLSSYMRLLAEVVRAQAPVIQAFLSLEETVREVWAQRPGGNGPASPITPQRLKSSPASPVSGSVPKKPAG